MQHNLNHPNNPRVLIPVKSFQRAKTRLANQLTLHERALLAQELCAHVLDVLHHVPAIAERWIITDDDEVAAFATEMGVGVLRDPLHSASQSAFGSANTAGRLGDIVDAGLHTLMQPTHSQHQHSQQRQQSPWLVLMADLPWLTPEDVTQMLAMLKTHSVVLAPDMSNMGTNALGLAAGVCVPTCFGYADSFERHRAMAMAQEQSFGVVSRLGLARDLDNVKDLDAYRAH